MSEVSSFTNFFELVRAKRGTVPFIARRLDIKPESVWGWVRRRQVPSGRVLVVEELTGIPRHYIRPDLHPQ